MARRMAVMRKAVLSTKKINAKGTRKRDKKLDKVNIGHPYSMGWF
jgi:hypothetical protein